MIRTWTFISFKSNCGFWVIWGTTCKIWWFFDSTYWAIQETIAQRNTTEYDFMEHINIDNEQHTISQHQGSSIHSIHTKFQIFSSCIFAQILVSYVSQQLHNLCENGGDFNLPKCFKAALCNYHSLDDSLFSVITFLIINPLHRSKFQEYS